MPQWARSQSVGRRAPSADRNSPYDSVSLPLGSHGWSPASQHISHPRGAIAQLGERLDRTQEVAGSSPASSIQYLLLLSPRPHELEEPFAPAVDPTHPRR